MSEQDAGGVSQRYLTFRLAQEFFAIPLLQVKEVIAMPEVTPVPQTPPHFIGIMNLRGQVITVLDLRLKLGIKPQKGAETAVVIRDLADVSVGVVVDSVEAGADRGSGPGLRPPGARRQQSRHGGWRLPARKPARPDARPHQGAELIRSRDPQARARRGRRSRRFLTTLEDREER